MPSNRISQTRRFTIPEGWQTEPAECAFVPVPKGVMPFGPTELQQNLYAWAKVESQKIVSKRIRFGSIRSAEWN